MKCPHCRGTGQNRAVNGPVLCPDCDGKGVVRCADCGAGEDLTQVNGVWPCAERKGDAECGEPHTAGAIAGSNHASDLSTAYQYGSPPLMAGVCRNRRSHVSSGAS